MITKPFDNWNTQKKSINNSGEVFKVTRKRDVWIASVGKNIGYEQDGNGSQFLRPVLIVKRFNTKMVWGIPLSSHQKDFDFYHNFTDPDGKHVSAIIAQMKLLSTKRLIRKMYRLPKKEFDGIHTSLIGLLEN